MIECINHPDGDSCQGGRQGQQEQDGADASGMPRPLTVPLNQLGEDYLTNDYEASCNKAKSQHRIH